MKNIRQLNTIKEPEKTKIHVDDSTATAKFALDLAERLKKFTLTPERTKILLCIGTDRSTGDCLGPLVGSIMSENNQDFYTIYGTLEEPVHAANLHETLDKIQTLHHNPFIIAIDASLGQLENIGCVNLGNGSLLPGAGVSKKLPPVGQIHITGIVNIGGFMEYLVLQNTRLSLVMKIAELIAGGLRKAIPEYNRQAHLFM